MIKPITGLKHFRRVRGFTLIELMIVVVVVGLLAAAAMPSFSSFIAVQRIKTTSFDLMSTMIFARSEAMKRNNIVNVSYVPASNEIMVAVTTVVGGIATTTTLKQQSLPQSVLINCTGTCGASMDFDANGRLVAAFGPLEISGANSADKRCISIDLSGRPNSKKGAC